MTLYTSRGSYAWPPDITYAEWRARCDAGYEYRTVSPAPEQIARAEAFYAEYRALCERHRVAMDGDEEGLMVLVDGDLVLKETYGAGNPLAPPMKTYTYQTKVPREPAAS